MSSCVCMCTSLFTRGWNMANGGQGKKDGILSHKGLWQGNVGRSAGPSLQSVRLAPHLPCPSVHLPITHKPTPSSTTALTIDYTVLAQRLTLWEARYSKTKKLQLKFKFTPNGWTAGSAIVSPAKVLSKVKTTSTEIMGLFFFFFGCNARLTKRKLYYRHL